ncbi:TetR/AcrR family transcriptional regulator [Streptomyces sp. NPDC006012]|uniref:TetR/AcrR family transcriptional regulator n=1 Tax=Streptomyces sp. NPDC006012 TaxID=3364739 RepID=UPI0036BBA419
MPAVIAQPPHTRRASGIPEPTATASPIAVSRLSDSVGIDRIIATAEVTRATLYRHFPSKDDLVVAYLTQGDEAIRSRVGAARTEGASTLDNGRDVDRLPGSADPLGDVLRRPVASAMIRGPAGTVAARAQKMTGSTGDAARPRGSVTGNSTTAGSRAGPAPTATAGEPMAAAPGTARRDCPGRSRAEATSGTVPSPRR